MITLGRFISQKRKQMQITQEELAKRLHVSKSAIAKWETDGGIPDRDNLRRLAQEMKVSVDELHKVIDSTDENRNDANITADVIATLESYGYQVKRPGEK